MVRKTIVNYFAVCISILSVYLFSSSSVFIQEFFQKNSEHELIEVFFVIAFLFVLSFVIFYVSHIIKLPSFVFAIFFGIAAHDALIPITESKEILGVIVGLGATLILFGGGIETPFANFKKLIFKILSLSFVGLFLTAFLFSWTVYGISLLLGHPISIVVSMLLGAVLASTDPAAIIPILKNLRFKKRTTKDIIISESAVTDVTGTLLTVVFISMIMAGVKFGSLNQWYGQVFSAQSGTILFKQLFFGIIFGFIGYILLEGLMKFKKKYEQEFEADSAFFLFVPIVIFTMAISFGGSGYLAAFIGGLLFSLTEHLYETERFFNNVIDGFLKPIIFILLGSIIDVHSLIAYAPLGIIASLVFMLVIRPVSVFISLTPFYFWGKEKMTWKEMLFISSVRETGAIPAVLMVTIASLGIPQIEGLVEVGMWVILMTLIIEPLLLPYIAKYLKIAEPIKDKKRVDLNGKPVAVLVTRGKSFIERLPFVTQWVTFHGVKKVAILLCLENNYSLKLVRETEELAQKEFEKINAIQIEKDLPEIEFSFVNRKGFLHDNIEIISKENKNVTVIFVGKKMLDYRLSKIKNLTVPFYFVD
ncbi:MAG: Sodium/proton antiporter, CPA1 family [Candidatus Moranbacteria bacterium GW2011_GWE1_35_17]|nr:MAG: Sodium/proton antiporter, CPA1 family [Candidatus Moranbacteria bacterium GW2011_GWE1_35_17]KKP71906.1 MAG: Sodium/proton antiporter, CPA1 family [Candidatus Moranbacteria bacterium GW2011_GWE2_35_164]KKP83205.1 MAG: Sodium/proton antiporter, CPA1 family [Candidatus Moranbacteria bacterium GW2011_GWF2_35_54]